MNTILIVDDEYDFTRALSVVLGAKGFRVRAVYDGVAALQTLDEGAPAIVLLDVMLPLRSGLDVLKEMRADAKTKDVPVLLMSGAQPPLPKGDRHLGFLHKPFTFDELLEKVTAMLKSASAS